MKVWSFGVFDFLEPPTCETINRRREDCDTQLREAVYFMVRLTLFSCFPVALAKISDNGHISTLFFSYAKWVGVIKRDVQQVWEIMEELTIKDFPGKTSWKSIGGGRRSQRHWEEAYEAGLNCIC